MPTPNDKTKFKQQAQVRTLTLSPIAQREKQMDSTHYVEGYAARYDPYVLWDDGEYGKTFERFEPGCFDECDMSDVIFQFDHAGRVFARTTNGTLIVKPDDNGLFMAADLSKSAGARDIHADIEAGLLTKMSWRFRVGSYYVERTEGSKDVTIVHTKIPKIYDVSVVSIPANDNTEINARSFVSGVREEAARSEAELDMRRNRLRTKINITTSLMEE